MSDILDRVIGIIDPWTRGAFTGWANRTGESSITLDLAEEHFVDCMQDMLDDLREKLPATAGWQPIETAPKDGTEVLIRSDNGVRVAKYEQSSHFGGWFIPLQNGVTGGCFAQNVTGWMPAPEAQP